MSTSSIMSYWLNLYQNIIKSNKAPSDIKTGSMSLRPGLIK